MINRWRKCTVHLTSHDMSEFILTTIIHLQKECDLYSNLSYIYIKFTKHILHPAILQQIFLNISSAKSARLKPEYALNWFSKRNYKRFLITKFLQVKKSNLNPARKKIKRKCSPVQSAKRENKSQAIQFIPVIQYPIPWERQKQFWKGL